jgi:hypothetical protein
VGTKYVGVGDSWWAGYSKQAEGAMSYNETDVRAGGGGVTAPDQRIEATIRVATGWPVERATYPPRPNGDGSVRLAARQLGERKTAAGRREATVIQLARPFGEHPWQDSLLLG